MSSRPVKKCLINEFLLLACFDVLVRWLARGRGRTWSYFWCESGRAERWSTYKMNGGLILAFLCVRYRPHVWVNVSNVAIYRIWCWYRVPLAFDTRLTDVWTSYHPSECTTTRIPCELYEAPGFIWWKSDRIKFATSTHGASLHLNLFQRSLLPIRFSLHLECCLLSFYTVKQHHHPFFINQPGSITQLDIEWNIVEFHWTYEIPTLHELT